MKLIAISTLNKGEYGHIKEPKYGMKINLFLQAFRVKLIKETCNHTWCRIDLCVKGYILHNRLCELHKKSGDSNSPSNLLIMNL